MDWNGLIAAIGGSAAIAAGFGALGGSVILAFFNQRLTAQTELLKASLARVERLEADLLASRGASYAAIWTITHALNLFGTPAPINKVGLSGDLTDWYFGHGWLLTERSKEHYFLVQEVLNFAILKALSVPRPDDAVLFADDKRPVEVLKDLRKRAFALEAGENDPTYDELVGMVVNWKKQEKAEQERNAWVVLQSTMSSFRSAITRDLGSRDAIRPA